MIRDQFQDVKKVTSKEARKKTSMGERNYYAKRITTLQEINKSVGVSMVVTTVIMAIAYAFILLIFIFSQDTESAYELWKFLIWTAVFAIFLIATIVFYVFIKPSNKRKITHYKHELERLSLQALSKVARTYSFYGDNFKQEQIKKHAESKLGEGNLGQKTDDEGN